MRIAFFEVEDWRNDVVITPRVAFNIREAVERILAATAENINGFIESKPVNLV